MLVLVKIAKCYFLFSNKNFMKTFALIIWVCKHSDIKFEKKSDRDCNIAIFTSTSIFLQWLGEITHMLVRCLKKRVKKFGSKHDYLVYS